MSRKKERVTSMCRDNGSLFYSTHSSTQSGMEAVEVTKERKSHEYS